MQTNTQMGGAAVQASAPDAVWFLGTLALVKASAETTNGGFGPVENLMPAGCASPLLLAVPGGFERFIVEMGEPAAAPVLPPPTPPDMAKSMTLAAKYGIDILGPLPE